MDAVESDIVEALDDLVSDVHADDAMIARLLRDAQSATPASVHPRHVFWVRPLLAAAVVVAVAAVAALLVHLPGHDVSPASPHRSSHPHSPQRSSTPNDTARFRALSCTVAQPTPWRQALSKIVLPPGAMTSNPAGTRQNRAGLTALAVSAGGDVLASSASPYDAAVLVHPDGRTKILYRVPSSLDGQPNVRIGTGAIDRDWGVFDVVVGTGQTSVLEIDAVNLSSGSERTVWQAQPGNTDIVSDPQLLGRHVYWSEVSNTGHGHVFAYDLVKGTTSTISTGTIVAPQTVAGRVEWTRNGKIVGTGGGPALPSGFHPQPGKTSSLLYDESAFAWSAYLGSGRVQRLAIEMQAPGMTGPDIVYPAPTTNTYPTLLALSRPYVVFDDTHHVVALDTRTGAATDLLDSQPPTTSAQAAGGVIALSEIGAKGGTQLVLIRTGELTELHC